MGVGDLQKAHLYAGAGVVKCCRPRPPLHSDVFFEPHYRFFDFPLGHGHVVLWVLLPEVDKMKTSEISTPEGRESIAGFRGRCAVSRQLEPFVGT